MNPGSLPSSGSWTPFLAEDPDYSAQLVVYLNGQPIIDLWGGPHVTETSLTGLFSASKGISALALATLVEAGELDLDAQVTHYWPEFAQGDDAPLTVRQLLSHQSGRVSVPDLVGIGEFCDSEAMAQRLARVAPVWRPGSRFGYHGLTIGVFMEELCRRVAGTSLQNLYADQFSDRYQLDFFLGTTDEAEGRVTDVIARPGGGPAHQEGDPEDLAGYVSPATTDSCRRTCRKLVVPASQP